MSRQVVSVLEVGTMVWVPAPKEMPDIFLLGKVLAVDELSATVRTEKENRLETVDLTISPPFLANPTVEPDMTGLHFIHEPGILYCLEQRSLQSFPYTFMGSVLVAVNPLKPIPNPTNVGTRGVLLGPPHPYAVAESSFQQMTFQGLRELSAIEKSLPGSLKKASQSIVIGGESGAGKTESAKMVLQHLVNRQSKASSENKSKMNGLDSRLLGTNPILEAFGNATTTRNPNSSRFGKMLRLHFDPPPNSQGSDEQWSLHGATVQSYLLERSRVTTHEVNERGYHIMYFVIAGAKSKIDGAMADLDLETGLDTFKYTLPRHPKQNDAKDLELAKELLEAFNAIEFSKEDRRSVFEIVAGIIHMGNLEFGEKETNDGASAFVANENVLKIVSRLLGVDGALLSRIFCERRFEVAGKEVVTVRNARAAGFAKDAVAKAIYSNLFDWIIRRIDIALGGAGANPDMSSTIGVLDIFGFEMFVQNGFEQLLINYTNEALQGTFNSQIFIAEAALYQKEGLFGSDDYLGQPMDNGICIELLQGDPSKKGQEQGLLMTIDSEGRVPDPSDAKLNQRLHTNFGAHPCMIKPHPKDKATTFIIKHYAATVTYTVGTFLEKNNDRLPDDMESTLKTSSKKTVVEIFDILDKAAAAAAAAAPPAAAPAKAPAKGPPPPPGKAGQAPRKPPARSIVHKFQAQIKGLVDDLEATKCSFIRCVKPNAAMVRNDADSSWFDRKYVTKQLNALNIAQTAEVLRNGFPTRIEYQVLVDQYVTVLPQAALKSFYQSRDNKSFVRALFWAFEIDSNSFKLGITRVFFKGGKLAELQSVMKAATSGAISDEVVRRFRYYYARGKWRKAAIFSVCQHRFQLAVERAKKKTWVCEKMQSLVRMQIKYKYYRNVQRGAVMAQRCLRGKFGRKRFKKLYDENIADIKRRIEEARIRKDKEAIERAEREERERAELQKRKEEEERIKQEELEAALERQAEEREEEAQEMAEKRRKSIAPGEMMSRRRTSIAVGMGVGGRKTLQLKQGGKLRTRMIAVVPPPPSPSARRMKAESIDEALIPPPPPVFLSSDQFHETAPKIRKRVQTEKETIKRGSFFEFVARQQESDFQVLCSGFIFFRVENTRKSGILAKIFSPSYKWERCYYVLDKPNRLLKLFEGPEKRRVIMEVKLTKTMKVFKYIKDKVHKFGVELEDIAVTRKNEEERKKAEEKERLQNEKLHVVASPKQRAKSERFIIQQNPSLFFAMDTENLWKRWMKDMEDGVEGFRPSVPAKDAEREFEVVDLGVVAQLNLLLFHGQITQAEFDELLTRESEKQVYNENDKSEEVDEKLEPLANVLAANIKFGKGGILAFGSAGVVRKIDFMTFEEIVTLNINCRFYLKHKRDKEYGWQVPRTFLEYQELYRCLCDPQGPLTTDSRLNFPQFPSIGKMSRLHEKQNSQGKEIESWLRKLLGLLHKDNGTTNVDEEGTEEDDFFEVPPPPEMSMDPAIDPDNWRCVRDPETGELFYNNKVTGETKNESPFESGLVKKKDEGADALPEGWEEVFDADSGETYYVNLRTDEVTWDRPKKEIPVKKTDVKDLLQIHILDEFFDISGHAEGAKPEEYVI